jgi:amidase
MIHRLSATELAQAIRHQQVSAVDVVANCFEQIDRHNPRLNAVVTLCQARAEAEAIRADAAIAQGETLGALHGIPFTVKDLTPTANVRTTFGSQIYRDYVPPQDELCVARLRAAGGILVGKTNTPEFGMGAHCCNSLFGATANPYDLARSSGGSSGGAAVAVAMGMGHLAQGTDMGGSCRTPASFCGVVGVRPSAGRIPRRRKSLLWDFLDTDGILARTVEDAALMLSVMAGDDSGDPLSAGSTWKVPDFSRSFSEMERSPIRLAFSSNLGIATIDSEVEAVFHQAISKIATHQMVEAHHPDCSRARFAFETLRAATLLHKQKHHYETYSHLLSDSVRWNVERGLGISAADLLQAEADRDQLYLNFLHFFETYDVLATVSASIPPFLHTQPEIMEINGISMGSIIDYLTITYAISLTGLPALSIPCGYTTSGLPIGMQLIGKPRGETALFQFAYFLQEVLEFNNSYLQNLPSGR